MEAPDFEKHSGLIMDSWKNKSLQQNKRNYLLTPNILLQNLVQKYVQSMCTYL